MILGHSRRRPHRHDAAPSGGMGAEQSAPRMAVRQRDPPSNRFRVLDRPLDVLVGMSRSSHRHNPSLLLTVVNKVVAGGSVFRLPALCGLCIKASVDSAGTCGPVMLARPRVGRRRPSRTGPFKPLTGRGVRLYRDGRLCRRHKTAPVNRGEGPHLGVLAESSLKGIQNFMLVRRNTSVALGDGTLHIQDVLSEGRSLELGCDADSGFYEIPW
jgi:hypothetical protein